MRLLSPGALLTIASPSQCGGEDCSLPLTKPTSSMKPVRRIATNEDLDKFRESPTYGDLLGFVESLNAACFGHELGPDGNESETVLKLRALVGEVAAAVDRHPSGEQSSRFGKPEFRDFYDDVESHMLQWLEPFDLGNSAEEVATYVVESWGNRKRIDYGSGHELNFVCALLCLQKLGKLSTQDHRNLALDVFADYLTVMRKIQKEYWLEPAGSHGVWGLDDYHFLPFLLGSGQLVPHKYLRPMSIHDEDMVDMYASKYYYFGCIKFINSVKTASLRWHSPMLDDISGVKKWEKVNSGMLKMYRAEVLGKLPIMQHFMFGSIIPAPEGMTPPDQVGDTHQHDLFDCCGIPVPSAVAAAAAERRTIPFD